jgi:hypothetical protein
VNGALLGSLVLGLVAGILSGMFGVGGAVITTPGIRALGATPIAAVGSTVPAILPGSVTGALRYSREGLVNWRVGLVCGVAGTAFAALGTVVSDHVNAHGLMVLTAVLVAWAGIDNLTKGIRARHDGAPRMPLADGPGATMTRPGNGALFGVGAVAGSLAGLLGVGGGIVMVPLFINRLHLPVKEAVASSLVSVAIFSTVAMVGHALLGHINWGFAIPLAVGTIPGARIGAHWTISASEAKVRIYFGIFLVALALVYGTRELMAIL